MLSLRKATDRGHANHGWLDTFHSFSFAQYYDPEWMGFRSLRVINEDTVQAGHGFGMHGHQNMEILTYVIAGQLEHRDSLGNGRIIQPGEVQYMSAGSGVRHSEFNPSKSEPAHFLQIWIEPHTLNDPPSYADRTLDSVQNGIPKLIASHSGREQSFAIRQDADLWLIKLERGNTYRHFLAPGRAAWLHVATGKTTVNGVELSAGDAAAIEGIPLQIEGLSESEILLFDLG